MGLQLTEGVRQYLSDKTIRAGIEDLLSHDEDKSEFYLPWDQAREFARAKLMAQIVRADLIDLLFALWDEVWGPHVRRLGREIGFDDVGQCSFMPGATWNDRSLERNFEIKEFIRLSLAIYFDGEEPEFHTFACFSVDKKSEFSIPQLEQWERCKDNDDCLVACERFALEKFGREFETCVATMKQQAAALIDRVAPDPA